MKIPEFVRLVSLSKRNLEYKVAEGKIPSFLVGGNRLYDPVEVAEALKRLGSEGQESLGRRMIQKETGSVWVKYPGDLFLWL